MAACLLASLAGCADLLGIEELSPRDDAGADSDGGPADGGGPPPAPALRSPMNGSRIGSLAIPSSRRPTLTWEAIPGATYVLEYTTDPTFTTGLTRVETSEPVHLMPADLPVSLEPPVGARYHWRVTTCIGTRCSMPSRPWYFDLARLRPDVNGDGYDDVLVGAFTDTQDTNVPGTIHVYQGGPGALFDTQRDGEIPPLADERLGVAVAMGDFNGDGFAEMVGGSRLSPEEIGGVYVYPGAADVPGVIYAPEDALALTSETRSGVTLVTGDFSGDGFADLIIGQVGVVFDGREEPGQVLSFTGQPGAFSPIAVQILRGAEVGDGFGRVLANAGDVNGDGSDDLLVGIPGARQVNIYFGTLSANFDRQPSAVLSEPQVANFATSVAGAGDVDGDGYHDVLVGAPNSVYLYRGGEGAFDTESDGIVSGVGQPGFGTVMSAGGDMDGDGRGEVVIGYASDASSWGIALYSSTSGPFSDLRFNLGFAGNLATAALSRLADLNGDSLSDLVLADGPNSEVHVYLSGDLVVPRTYVLQPPGTGIGFGASIAP